MSRPYTPVKAPRGSKLSCKSWLTEAPMRLLMNNLDPEVAEDPEHLVVYGGSGRAARSWVDFDAIVYTLKQLADDETLLVQSGRPVGVFKSHSMAPRVLIANSLIVPAWASWDEFRDLEAAGLTMFGQMTAGSWIYIGTQGIVQGTYETFAAVAEQSFAGDLKGRLIVSAGLGGMGGAQPLAATMNGATFLAAEVDPARIAKRLDTGYLDVEIEDLDAAIDRALELKGQQAAQSIGWAGNAVTLLRRLKEREITPDVLTDQTSAHDMIGGYVPEMPLPEARALRKENPKGYEKKAMATVSEHVRLMIDLKGAGAVTFDYGNNIRAQAELAGVENAFDFPGFVPAYIRPQFCEGRGPFRWVALSGDPEDIYKTDETLLELFPEDESLKRWLTLAREKVAFQGLPARICWLGYGERAKAGLAFNKLVRDEEVSAPIVIGRDHLDAGSVASPFRETEDMKDGSDVIADWPILNALMNTAAGATWVSVHHGGGVGIGYSIHAGLVVVANGSPEADERLARVLAADPGLGVARHVDAGYEIARETARERGVRIPHWEARAAGVIPEEEPEPPAAEPSDWDDEDEDEGKSEAPAKPKNFDEF